MVTDAIDQDVIPRKDQPIEHGLRFRFDVWILLAMMGLLIAGMLAVYSASYDSGQYWNDDPYFFISRQFIYMLIGLAAMVITLQFDYHFLRKLSIPIILVVLALLVLVLFFGRDNFGARRALDFGPFELQPSELAKLAMIIYTAHWLSSKGSRLKSVGNGLVPFALMIGILCGLVVPQPDLKTALLLAAIGFTMFFLAGASLRHFAFTLLIMPIVFLVAFYSFAHVSDRLMLWQASWQDPLQSTHDQVKNITLALGSGGIFGKGPGHGTLKYLIPAVHADGTFAVWAEEYGFLGSLFVIGSFALLAWRGILAARAARDMYGYLLAVGITCWISYQALLNMAVITSTIPFTGVPMPFMAYGGTSLITTLTAIGILLNVSRDAAIGRTLKRKTFAFTRESTAADEDNDLRRRDGGTHLPGARRRRRAPAARAE